MRVLFYTAIGFFLGLSALVAFYALQAPPQGGGAKVVLNIDVSGMPKEAENQLDQFYAEQEAKLNQAGEQSEQGRPADVAAANEVTPPDGEFKPSLTEPQQQQQPSGAELEAPVNDAKPADVAQPDSSFDSPPQTQERPVADAHPGFDERQLAAAAAQAEQAVMQRPAAEKTPAKTETPIAANNLSAVEEPRLPPVSHDVAPPLPVRRPAAVPAETPVKTAAAGGWASQQIPVDEASGQKQVRVAILIRGLGQDRRDSMDAIEKLPSAVSLGFIPTNDDAQEWAAKAQAAGHEVILQLPLEPSDYPANNPGPDTLLTSATAEQNVSRLRDMLGRFKGYTGVSNFMGGKLLQSRQALQPIMADIKARGLSYIGEGNNSHAVVRRIAQDLKLRYGNASVMIDTHPTPDAIMMALKRLVLVAQKQGSAIGMGTASAATIEQLQTWSQTLSAEGITLVPVGALAHAPGAS